MGIASSRSVATGEVHIGSESEIMAENPTPTSNDDVAIDNDEDEFHDTSQELPSHDVNHEMEEFNKQLALKREQRREVLAKHREEKENLKKNLAYEREAKREVNEENRRLKELLKVHNIEIPNEILASEDSDIRATIAQMQEEFENLRDNNNRLRRDLAEANLSLQSANSDIASLNRYNVESTKQINALKEVISVSKTMINLREQQLNELKEKLSEIEKSLSDRESSLLSTDLRQEYERQLQNIRTLRGLYEERARLAEINRLNLLRELEEEKRQHLADVNRCLDLTQKVEDLEGKVNKLLENIENKKDQIMESQNETKGLKAEMSTVNKLFSQVLLGYKSNQNWDQLVQRLEENHGILTQMVEKSEDSESSSELPKLLLELVSQVDECDAESQKEEQIEENVNTDELNSPVDKEPEAQNASAEEIVRNLPKVWKVLMELLSHQNSNETNSMEKVTTCYKTVETASGSVLVPSVSQTYIRLKDLIIEKLALIREVNRMKQLNVHLESRLEGQERRLCLVTSELSKTWHVVGRLRRHHHQLHTHEKILKYELQQKRKLLNELKEELEFCREKCEKAREKNIQSERDWRKLRAEFSSRKLKGNASPSHNSAESGYSDERISDDSSESNDESEYVNEAPLRCKKKQICSFENVLDSSADINLAAEREDPISDMLDVAELPLDTHETDDGVEHPGTPSIQLEVDDKSTSFSCTSNILLSDKNCEDTEDEMAEMSTENLDDNVSSQPVESTCANQYKENVTRQSDINNIPSTNVDSATILENIRIQNERLLNKDKTLESLERQSSSLLEKSQNTLVRSELINETLDKLLSRPGTSKATEEINVDSKAYVNNESNELIDPKQILANVKRQNELLKKKDERLNNLEVGCKEVLKSISNTISTGNLIDEKLNILNEIRYPESSSHSASTEAIDVASTRETLNSSNDIDETEVASSEPSTSKGEIDHEARFAARDIRLKRLEEQTKSLVDKVNDTATKRVKLHYKLEELHNIYGSENSRAGSPSEDQDEARSNDEEEQN